VIFGTPPPRRLAFLSRTRSMTIDRAHDAGTVGQKGCTASDLQTALLDQAPVSVTDEPGGIEQCQGTLDRSRAFASRRKSSYACALSAETSVPPPGTPRPCRVQAPYVV
jgi:hypothetical protein